MKLGDKDIKQIKIVFDVEKQRYDTLGDYLIEDNELVIKISKMGDIYQLVVMIHELVESLLCILSGVEFQEIDEFDMEYENARERGEKVAPCGCLIHDELGDDIHAPYHKQHKIAEIFEYLFLQHISNTLYKKEVEKDE